MNNLSELNSIEIDKVQKADVKVLEHSTEKWTKYFLDENEIQLLRKIIFPLKFPSHSGQMPFREMPRE